jgi:hypothetical protein
MLAPLTTWLLVSSPAVVAQPCDIVNYDTAPPAAVIGNVSRPSQGISFQWASDVDPDYAGRGFIWNYVLNRGDRPLRFAWPKAEFRTGPKGLAPGRPFCLRLSPAADRPDPDAPITYGVDNPPAPASAFVRVAQAKGPTTTFADFAYVDELQEVRQVGIRIQAEPSKDGAIFSLEASPDVIIGISGFAESLLKPQFESVLVSMKNQDTTVVRARLSEFLGTGAGAYLSDLFPDHEIKSKLEEEYVFFRPYQRKSFVIIPGSQIQERRADLIALDGDHRPIFATRVHYFAPTR